MAYKTIVEDNIDILVAGAGLGGTGAAFEARYWGQDKKIVIAEKANIDRSGAVAQGLYAINCYMGTRFGENNPEDHVRYARIDLMGMVREDLLFVLTSRYRFALCQSVLRLTMPANECSAGRDRPFRFLPAHFVHRRRH